MPRAYNEANNLVQIISDTKIEDEDWRKPISQCLLNPRKEQRKLKLKLVNYVLLDGELFRKSMKDEVLLRYLGVLDVIRVMTETYESI